MTIIDEMHIHNWQATGGTAPVGVFTFDLEVIWTDDGGFSHRHAGTYTWPNDLAAMPLAVRKRFAETMIEAKLFVALGLNTWVAYL